MLRKATMFQPQKEEKAPNVIYYPVHEYKKDHWALQFPKPTDENFIALLKMNDVLMHVKLNPTDARGYRTIVTIVAEDMTSTLNRVYSSKEKCALQLSLGLVSEAYEKAGCPIVQQQIAGNNSQSLTGDGIVQIGNEKEPNMLHGHIIVRGNPKKAYINDVVLKGPEPKELFNMRGDGLEEGNKSKIKWGEGEMNIVASIILEQIKLLIKNYNMELVTERAPKAKIEFTL